MPHIPHTFRTILLAGFTALAGAATMILPPSVSAEAAQPSERESYVFFEAGKQSSMMSGSTEDYRRARSLRAGNEGLLYVSFGGADYVIRDAATLRQAESIFEPQQALGKRQAELGSRQAELGSRQARLGAEQARIGSRQVDASPSQAVELGRQQNELGRKQNDLGQQQAALGRQQDALGREQDRLGREAATRLRSLIADALRRGVAQRVD